MSQPIFKTKPIEKAISEALEATEMKRTLSAFDLVLLGIGCVIGTGIFVLTGNAAAANAGPAISVSFVLAGLAAALAGLCYAEMAAMLPIGGSAYAYTYATLGELVAWLIGWNLILEYLVGAATVSVGWSGYVSAFCHDILGFDLPARFASAPFAFDHTTRHFVRTDAIINLPAVLIVMMVSLLLVLGTRESARVNAIIVIVKLAAILLFLVAAAPFVRVENWHPFVPPNEGTFGRFGVSGVFQGATTVFFSYVGFDAVSTAAQEARRPRRDVPIGILVSLVICTVLYVAVSLVLTGVVPYARLSVPHPIALAVEATGQRWLMGAIEVGAICGLTSVILVFLLGQPRIFRAMAQDGLFFEFATRLHPRLKTPHIITITNGLLCSLLCAFLPIDILSELTSIGTLFAFAVVSLGILILRKKRPDLPRKFRVPGGDYLIPCLSVLANVGLMASATATTRLRLLVWMVLGLLFYAAYGRRYSKLRRQG